MAIKTRNSEAEFRIFSKDDSSFAIEIVIPESNPTTVSSFSSRQAAESWISAYKERLERAEAPRRRSFRTSVKPAPANTVE